MITAPSLYYSPPKEDNLVVCSGSKGDDILFANSLKILDEKIYMKLMEIKKV